jgi:glycosyltransferase involved in cell wall biosynthesis
MKILVVTHYYSTHAGGIEIVAGRLATQLASSHDVVWAASNCDPPPAVPPRVQLLRMRTLNAVERLTGLPFPLWGPRSLGRLCRAVSRADVVHLHDIAYFGNWAAFTFARLRGVPILITQHAGLIRYRSSAMRMLLRALHMTAGRTLLKNADRVVFISPVVREYFRRFVAFRNEPEIIFNGVDTDLYTPSSAGNRGGVRAQFALSSAPVVLFVGRFVEAKGLPTIRSMAERLPDVTFALAGWGPVDPRTWNLPNVRVFSSLRGPTLVPLYQAADLLVLPSLGEGLPLVVQEALACGLRAFVDPDTAESVGAPIDAVRGFPVDVTEWTAAVQDALAQTDDADQRRMARARFARDRWSWPAAAARYSELFETIVRTARSALERVP